MSKPRLYTEGDILEEWILLVTSLHRRSFKAWLVLAASHKWFMEHERIQRELTGHSSIVAEAVVQVHPRLRPLASRLGRVCPP